MTGVMLFGIVLCLILSAGSVMQARASAERVDEAESARREADIKIADLIAAVENMRAIAGPFPPVILHRTSWEQDEMNLEMQPSEAAAIIARMTAQEDIQRLIEERLLAIERRRDSRQIEAQITAIAVEIRRHMAANRSDFETQALRRIAYCEEHVDTAHRRLNLIEFGQVAQSCKAKTRKKRQS
jgi:hypothetical protein